MGERLVRALEKNENGKGFSPVTFSLSAVERVKGVDETHSLLILVSGFKIPVALPYAELEQKIYRPDFKTDDSETLDLTAVTGKTAQVIKGVDLKPGDVADDGTIYLGFHTGKDWFVTDRDAPLEMTFNAAAKYAENLNIHGHDDWVVPNPNILQEMFNNKSVGAFRNTYNEGASGHSSDYWSSEPYQNNVSDWAWEQNFKSGKRDWYGNLTSISVRYARAELRPPALVGADFGH
jgi:hypothetical protein